MAKFLVTGVFGCIGTWVARRLIERGESVVGADLSDDRHRHDFLIRPLPDADRLLTLRQLDIADTAAVDAVIREEKPDAIIHLAALQLPICKANPILCADVNVRGVMNFLELSRSHPFSFVYASSTAVYGPGTGEPFGEHENLKSLSLYGVFKRANEEMARIYWNDYQVSSVGLRPWTVYGPGRDVGLTADVTHALYHSARDEPYHVRFSGDVGLEHCSEVADAFIVAAATRREGAHVHTLGGPVLDVADAVSVIEHITGRTGLITVDPKPLGIACDTTDASFQSEYGPFPYRPIEVGFEETIQVWRRAGMV